MIQEILDKYLCPEELDIHTNPTYYTLSCTNYRELVNELGEHMQQYSDNNLDNYVSAVNESLNRNIW